MIEITAFAASRHFDPAFRGTKITSHSVAEFVEVINSLEGAEYPYSKLVPGYAPFCKHLFVENFTNARQGVVRITDENRGLLRTGFEARREDELRVLARWFEGVEPSKAPWLDVILYSSDQLAQEGIEIQGDWGVGSINSATAPEEAPMKPITMMRNALGVSEGGSGVALDRDQYAAAVEYWSRYATVK